MGEMGQAIMVSGMELSQLVNVINKPFLCLIASIFNYCTSQQIFEGNNEYIMFMLPISQLSHVPPFFCLIME